MSINRYSINLDFIFYYHLKCNAITNLIKKKE
jgi:hypothetical protein